MLFNWLTFGRLLEKGIQYYGQALYMNKLQLSSSQDGAVWRLDVFLRNA